MGTRARRFFARFNRLELSAPLVQASSGHPELLGQLIDAFTALHPLYGHALKLPGISLSSLHECFLSRRVCPSRVCQFKGSFHSVQVLSNAIERLKGSPASPGPKRVFRTGVSEMAGGLTCPCKPVGHANGQKADDNAWHSYRIGSAGHSGGKHEYR